MPVTEHILGIFFCMHQGSLLGAPGIATRSKDATRGSWPYYQEQEATSNKKLVGFAIEVCRCGLKGSIDCCPGD